MKNGSHQLWGVESRNNSPMSMTVFFFLIWFIVDYCTYFYHRLFSLKKSIFFLPKVIHHISKTLPSLIIVLAAWWLLMTWCLLAPGHLQLPWWHSPVSAYQTTAWQYYCLHGYKLAKQLNHCKINLDWYRFARFEFKTDFEEISHVILSHLFLIFLADMLLGECPSLILLVPQLIDYSFISHSLNLDLANHWWGMDLISWKII